MNAGDPLNELAATSGPAPAPASSPAAGAPPVAPAKKPNRVVEFFKRKWARVTAETEHRPAEYTGHRLAQIINEELDGFANYGGRAHRAKLGESVTLLTHSLMHSGDANTPLGFVTESGLEYAWLSWDEQPEREELRRQKMAAMAAAAKAAAPPSSPAPSSAPLAAPTSAPAPAPPTPAPSTPTTRSSSTRSSSTRSSSTRSKRRKARLRA